ncbi:two-component system, chemotaxis family, CheB/CheR fusion protein [Mucilaginibacter pineti]|uniref:histidine kinase n=1 Tax=Mucilaginibacter pineti TaxID=1391627 RepID=A0A1G7H612_9SPHI|nr:PAS domain-containing sensor histidine kinase [Mucilaginibacter pineti]SDE95897.1 two-component system, chemotaxis family, CheB/CheR fusion protein [Mucilaginibacter pineti]
MLSYINKHLFENGLLLRIGNAASSKSRPLWLKLIAPLLLSFFATWLLGVPLQQIGRTAPFIFYFAVVFVCACLGGSISAFWATIFSSICAVVFILHVYPLKEQIYFGVSAGSFTIEGLLLTGLIRIIEITQHRLSSEKTRLREILENNPEGFLTADEDGTITYVCSSVEKILGFTPAELKTSKLHDLIHPSEEMEFKLNYLRLLHGKSKSVPFLQRLRSKNGEWKWIEGCVNNMLRDEPVKAIVFNYRNVTSRINKARQQDDFVHIASHELKTPITSLKGFSQLIKLKHLKEGRTQDLPLVERMEAQLDRLLALIDDMLNMTRIHAGEMHYHKDWFDFAGCITEVTEAVQATCSSHSIKIFNLTKPVRVYADRNRISQVITNLVTNAIKYSPDANSVELEIECSDDEIRLNVRDYGIGIPQDKQSQLFERFYRVDGKIKEQVNGLGLGLFIAREIVEKHDGKLGLISTPGKGSTFWFSLPMLR